MAEGSETLLKLAVSIVYQAEELGLSVRLLGGLAVASLCQGVIAEHPALRRSYADIDFAAYSRDRRDIERLAATRGFEPVKQFNFLSGGRRLMFLRSGDASKIDVFLDQFNMCHDINFKGRLELTPPTLPYADLMLTKLQTVQPAKRDVQDLVALFLAKAIYGRQEPQRFSDRRIIDTVANDWGWYRTVSNSIHLVSELTSDYLPPRDSDLVRSTSLHLSKRLENCPKSLKWHIRALVGERVRWYEVPEEPIAEPVHVTKDLGGS